MLRGTRVKRRAGGDHAPRPATIWKRSTVSDPDDEEQPMFDSLDAMCTAFGFDDMTKEKIRLAMEMTARREPGDPVQ